MHNLVSQQYMNNLVFEQYYYTIVLYKQQVSEQYRNI